VDELVGGVVADDGVVLARADEDELRLGDGEAGVGGFTTVVDHGQHVVAERFDPPDGTSLPRVYGAQPCRLLTVALASAQRRHHQVGGFARVASGRGFYSSPDPAFAQPGFI